ncbi:MAG: DUF1501 domain-containing protein [Pseudomonadota bacterium]
MRNAVTRRSFLARTAAIGCSAAASPALTPVTLAAAPWDSRLVVIVLRGGMDALDVVRPVSDPHYSALRPTLASGDQLPVLDGAYALHPGLSALMPLWDAGQLGFVQAVATPYRNKRSHFDGQDLLESGGAGLDGVQSGWLNRAIGLVPGATVQTGLALGISKLKLLSGSTPVVEWAPNAGFELSPATAELAERLMREDQLFADAFVQAKDLSSMAASADRRRGRSPAVRLASFAAEQLRGSARVAAFSINGWDTHSAQARGLTRALGNLSDAVLTLKEDLGAQLWGRTTILAMTEFGRTVRENGTRGTDHGTGGAMIYAGGMVRGRQIAGRWPGLEESDLLDRRDLMPTSDIRAHVAGVLQAVAGLDRHDLEMTVFPGLDIGSGPDVRLI